MKTVTKPIALSMYNRHPEAKNVLLLEDDVEFNASIKDYLGGDLYNIVPVQNGFEGMKTLDRQGNGVKKWGQLLKLDVMLGILQALVRWPDRFEWSSRARSITLPREETKGGGFSAVTKTNANF